jgi:hypothetical protein
VANQVIQGLVCSSACNGRYRNVNRDDFTGVFGLRCGFDSAQHARGGQIDIGSMVGFITPAA